MPTYPLHGGHTPLDRDQVEAFLQSIASAPGNGLPRLMFSDYLDEHGYTNAAAGQRWAAREGKYPAAPDNPHPMGGWYYPGTVNLRGLEDYETFQRHQLHGAFEQLVDRGRASGTPVNDFTRPVHTLFSHQPRNAAGTIHSERGFLHASHMLDWHPETGEPLNPDHYDDNE